MAIIANRMASENYWLEHVLEKLRERLLSGKPLAECEWEYDSSSTQTEEDRVLSFLETLGVFRSRLNTMAFKIESNGAVSYDSTDTSIHSRTIHEFNADNYERVCTRYGIEPYEERYAAHLELIDGVTPVVTVGSEHYEFRSMYEGKAATAIRYCLEHEGELITLKELRGSAGVKPLNNIPQIFKEGHFSKTGALTPFIRLTPDTAKLTATQKLTKDQVARIRSASKSTK